MYPEFSIPKAETDYKSCVQQSNEILIPRPIALCFHYPGHPPEDEYLADLRRELELKSRLFDHDREVHQLNWVGLEDRVDDNEISDLLVAISEPFFRFDEHYDVGRIDSYELVSRSFDLVGLGPAAISRIENIFFQNTKDPARYHAQLSQRQLPVSRG